MSDEYWDAMIVTAKAGNSEARVAVVEKVLEDLRPWAKKRMTPRFETSGPDRFQETRLQAHLKFDQFKEATFAAFHAWVWRILSNCIHDGFARFKRHPVESLPPDKSGDEKTPGTVVVHKELVAEVNQAVQALSDKEREVVLLRIKEQLTFPEIAEKLDFTVGKVKVTYYRAVKSMRVALTGRAAIPSSEGSNGS